MISNPATRRRRSRRGMSLVEVMVVIAIIVTLMSIFAFGALSVYQGTLPETTKLQMSQIKTQVDALMLKKKLPSTSEGLAAAYGDQAVPKDSWNNDFIYVTPGPNGMEYDIISYGSDGVEGGTGNAEDIKLSDLRK